MIRYLLDTNTISELQRKIPDANVENWFYSHPISQLYLSSFTIAEIEAGIHHQRDLERAKKLQTWLETVVLVKFTNRILPFDTSAARVYGRWAGENRKNGTPLTVTDTQIAAISYVHGLVVATRNTSDFKSLPIQLVNPWLQV
jgi:predicted nucleic acid-binding protein